MNKLEEKMVTGTIGELLFQLRLLQYGVQAAAPLKDSGNDLIAVRGDSFRAIQVKTTRKDKPRWDEPERHFHLLAIACLTGEDNELHLDDCDLFLVPKEEISKARADSEPYRLNQALIDRLFKPL